MAQTMTVENYKGIKGEVTLTPNGSNLVVIAGANGAGKSSFLDALRELIKYKGSKLTPEPIREGQTEARAEFVDTELDVRLERVWKLAKDGTTKSTFNAYALNGQKYPSAVDLVAELTGGEIIDPVEFVLLDEKKQRDTLLKKVDLPFDLDKLTQSREARFEERTNVNRKVRDLEGDLAGRVKPDAETPTEEVSAATIIAEFEEARAHNEGVNQLVATSEMSRVALDRAEANLADAQQIYDSAKLARTAALEAEADIEFVDVESISARLAGVEQTNAAIREGIEYKRAAASLAEKQAESDGLTAKLEAIDKQKVDGLSKAVFPAAGLSVTDEGVTVEGVPFIQLNDAEKVVVGFDIATSGDPKLKLIFIKSGDMLDDTTLALIAARGVERGYTIVTERGRDNSSEIGFTFAEGGLL